jgi:uncharacterized protein YodC (DUF2158 family)
MVRGYEQDKYNIHRNIYSASIDGQAKVHHPFRRNAASAQATFSLSEVCTMPLKVGDVVRLKTGGPEMTVEAADARDADVICTWLADEAPQHRRFKSLALRKLNAGPVKKKRSSLVEGIDGP